MDKKSKINQVIDEDVTSIISTELPWESFSGMNIVVTGAGGFIGGYLLRTLLALNESNKLSKPLTVTALVRDINKAKVSFGENANNSQLTWLSWDLNKIGIPPIDNSCNYILHAASQASPKFYGSDPVGTLLPNSIGTASLLQALQYCAVPKGLLFISSSEVYGSVNTNDSISEDLFGQLDPAHVRSCYAESKRLGETMCVAWHQQFKVPTYIVRPFHTYGPTLKPDDGRVFADFSYNIVRGENIKMMSDGTARRAFCYITDAIVGIFTVLLKGQPATPYNIANSNAELSIMDLADMLVALYPEKSLKVEQLSQRKTNNYLASNFNRLIPNTQRMHDLGWNAEIMPQIGFSRMIEAHSE